MHAASKRIAIVFPGEWAWHTGSLAKHMVSVIQTKPHVESVGLSRFAIAADMTSARFTETKILRFGFRAFEVWPSTLKMLQRAA